MIALRRILLLQLLGLTLLSAQVREGAPDSFAPQVNGPVHDLLLDREQAVIMVGEFTSVNGVARGGIARILPNGDLDPDFASGSGANGAIRCLTSIRERLPPTNFPRDVFYVAGEFTTFDGEPRNKVARLMVDGSPDSTFDPGLGPDGVINCIRNPLSGGALYVGGDFTTFNGFSSPNLVALDATGEPSRFDRFEGQPNAPVLTMDVVGENLCVGGEFSEVGALNQRFFVAFNLNNLRFASNLVDLDGPVTVCKAAAPFEFDSDVLLFGDFTRANGHPRPGFVRLAGFSLQVTGEILSVSGGTVHAVLAVLDRFYSDPAPYLVAGDFTSIMGLPWPSFARLTATESNAEISFAEIDPTLDPGTGTNGSIKALAQTGDGRFYLAGDFTSIDGQPRSYLARTYGPWLDQVPETPSACYASPVSDTSVALHWSAASRRQGHRVERLSADGVTWETVTTTSSRRQHLDTGLAPSTNYTYRAIATNYNGESAPSPQASAVTFADPWTGDGLIDTSFTEKMQGRTQQCALSLPDGRLLIGGTFSSFQNQPRKYIAMVLPDGDLDPAFDLGEGPDRAVYSVGMLPNGQFLVGGAFRTWNGTDMKGIARLNADGTLDPTFQSPFTGSGSATVRAILVYPDGRYLIGGSFRSIGGIDQGDIALLHPDGALDPSFDPGAGATGEVTKLSFLPDGRILALGAFRYNEIVVNDDPFAIHPDGTLVAGFSLPITGFYDVFDWAFDAAGHLYLAGRFDYGDSLQHSNVMRLLPDLSIDPTFTPPVFGDPTFKNVRQIALTRENKVVITGAFPVLDTSVVAGIARLEQDGSLDPGFLAPQFYPDLFTVSSFSAHTELLVTAENAIVVVGANDLDTTTSPDGLLRLIPGTPQVSAVPSNLAAIATSSSSIRLTWSFPQGAWSVALERSPDGISDWTPIGESPNPAGIFDDLGLAPAATWHYRATAVAGPNSSPPTDSVMATTLSAFEQWLADRGVATDTDPLQPTGADRTPLLLAYALDLPDDPSATSEAKLQIFSLFGRLYLVYPRPRSDLIYRVEQSPNLATWSADGVDQGPTGPAGIASIPLTPNPAGHLRLTVRQR